MAASSVGRAARSTTALTGTTRHQAAFVRGGGIRHERNLKAPFLPWDTGSCVQPKPKLEHTQLLLLLLGDVLAAAVASFAVSPIVCAIDKGIAQFASGVSSSFSASVMQSFRLALQEPIKFLTRPEFLMIWAVYLATYVVANVVMTLCQQVWAIDTEAPKFLAVSSTNIFACVSKDAAFSKMFGSGESRPLPLTSYALFTARDCATIGASFNLPSIVARRLEMFGMPLKTAESVAQLLCPCFVQFFSTPVHLLGFNIYNQPDAGAEERWATVCRQYWSSVIGRVARIAPAFGFGGIGNKALRDAWRAAFGH